MQLLSWVLLSRWLELLNFVNKALMQRPFSVSGYQREFNYRRNDKSFSAFGEFRPGSTWFVLK